MPLTFEQAKLQYNPDPLWKCRPGTLPYNEILKLMRVSGHVFDNPNAPTVQLPGSHNCQKVIGKKIVIRRVSKQEFLTAASNRKYIEEHILKNNNK
jgi:hypothetical protein